MDFTRRGVLASLGLAASTAGCLRLQGNSSSVDPAEWLVDPGYTLFPNHDGGEWSHVPVPERYAPAVVVRPPALEPVASRAPVQQLYERVFDPTGRSRVGVLDADLAVRGPRYVTAFGLDPAAVRESLESGSFEEVETLGDGTGIYAVPGDTELPGVAVGDDRVTLGKPVSLDRNYQAVRIPFEAQGDGPTELHTAEVPELGTALDETGDAGYAVAVPTVPAVETDAANGVFADEAAYAVGVDVADDEATVTVARVFQSDTPSRSALETWLADGPAPVSADASVDVEGAVVTATETRSAGTLTLETFSGQCRNAHEHRLPTFDGPTRNVSDGEDEAVVAATSDGYAPFSDGTVAVSGGGHLSLHFAAEDVIQAPVAETLASGTLVVPGEVGHVRVPLRPGVHEMYDAGLPEGATTPTGELVVAGERDDLRVAPAADALTIDIGVDDGLENEYEDAVISTGTTVTFRWQSDNHSLVVDQQPDGSDWRGHTETEQAGFTHDHTFSTPGTYRVVCGPHEGAVPGIELDVRPFR